MQEKNKYNKNNHTHESEKYALLAYYNAQLRLPDKGRAIKWMLMTWYQHQRFLSAYPQNAYRALK